MFLEILKSTMWAQMKQSFSRPMFRFCLIANPILNTILLYEMFRGSGNENFFAYVVLGAGLMGIWSCICFSSAGDINREKYSGTLSLIFVSPASFKFIMLGKIIGNTVMSLLALLITLVTAVILFKVPINIANPGLFLVSLIATLITFIIISTLIASILTLSRKTQLYMNCIEIPIILLSGFVLPVTLFPKVVRVFSYSLSSTYAAELLRMSVWGVNDTVLFIEKLAILIALTIIYAIISNYLFNIIDKKVRVNASLEVI